MTGGREEALRARYAAAFEAYGDITPQAPVGEVVLPGHGAQAVAHRLDRAVGRQDLQRPTGAPRASQTTRTESQKEKDMAGTSANYPRVTATEEAQRAAYRLGVPLATVKPTGLNGEITIDDVIVASIRNDRAAPVAAGPTFRNPVMVTVPSAFDPHRSVTISPYGANPLADDMRQIYPQQFAAAAAGDTPMPTLFSAGDLPVFTASGVDPRLLAPLPWQARHPIARTDQRTAAEWLDRFTPGPSSDRQALAAEAAMLLGSDEENMAYFGRLRAWLMAYQYNADTNTWQKDGGWIGHSTLRQWGQ